MRWTDCLPLLLLIALSACGGNERPPTPSTGCPSGTAMIAVGDGSLQTLCGCAEASPVTTGPGNRLTCTVTTGTLVQFHYLATSLRHQIRSSSQPAFPPSPVSDPGQNSSAIRVHVIRLENAGTYSFTDQMNASLVGDLIAL